MEAFEITILISSLVSIFVSLVSYSKSRSKSLTDSAVEHLKISLEAERIMLENNRLIEIERMKIEKEALKEIMIAKAKAECELELSKEKDMNSLILKIIETPGGLKRLDKLNKYLNR